MRFDTAKDHSQRLQAAGLSAMRLAPTITVSNKLRLEPPFHGGHGLNLGLPLSVGAFTLVNGSVVGMADVGRYCSLAAEVRIGSAEHPLDRITSSPLTWDPNFLGWAEFVDPSNVPALVAKATPFPGARPITTLGHDVWIGHGVFVKAGVTIGHGAVIGAGSVVVKDIPPYAIAAGIPARVVRFRFDEKTVARLCASAWWDYAILPLLGPEVKDPNAFLDRLDAAVAAGSITPFRPEIIDAARLRAIVEANVQQGQPIVA